MDVMNRLALKAKLNRVGGVHLPLILKELLQHRGDVESELVQGCIQGTTWHLWVHHPEDGILDILKHITPEFKNERFVYTVDVDTPQCDPGTVEVWENYNSVQSRQDFWKSCPKNVRDFRAKVFRVKSL